MGTVLPPGLSQGLLKSTALNAPPSSLGPHQQGAEAEWLRLAGQGQGWGSGPDLESFLSC